MATRSALERPAPSGGRILPQLDALRGAAILAVFAQHLGDRFMPFVEERVAARVPAALAPWILTVLHHAWWGVDLFFVLSGFSLAQGYVRAFERGQSPSAAAFLRRRAARVLPAYFVAIALIVAIRPWTVKLPGFAASIATHLALLQGYVTPGGIVLIGATWSLTTEAHFYLLMPAIARPLLRRRERAQLPWRGLAFGAALCLAAWLSRGALHAWALEPGAHTALLEATQRRWITSRLDQFVLGATAAAIHAAILRSGRARQAARAAPFGVVIAIATLIVAFRLEGELYLTPGGSWPYALISLATAALVLAACLCDGAASRVIAAKPLRSLGVVSYGFFLHHQLALGLVGRALGTKSRSWGALAANGALALALAAGMGLASWILIERPFIERAARRPRAA